MATFKFQVTVPANEVISSALGTGSGNVYSSPYDIGKAVKLSTADNHILATAGADIDGFINSIEPVTVNGGYSFGSVLVEGRIQAVVGPNQGATPMAPGDYVVADTQTALGSAGNNQAWTSLPGTAPSSPTGPTALVKTGSPAKKFWRCISIVSGTGVAGDVVVLERT